MVSSLHISPANMLHLDMENYAVWSRSKKKPSRMEYGSEQQIVSMPFPDAVLWGQTKTKTKS